VPVEKEIDHAIDQAEVVVALELLFQVDEVAVHPVEAAGEEAAEAGEKAEDEKAEAEEGEGEAAAPMETDEKEDDKADEAAAEGEGEKVRR